LFKVLIADSSNLTAERFKSVLSDIDNVDVVAISVSGETTLTLVNKLNPDLVLLDQSISDGIGIEILGKIKKTQSGHTGDDAAQLCQYPLPRQT